MCFFCFCFVFVFVLLVYCSSQDEPNTFIRNVKCIFYGELLQIFSSVLFLLSNSWQCPELH